MWGALQTQRSRTVMHAAAAMWCLVRLEANRYAVLLVDLHILKRNASHKTLVLDYSPETRVRVLAQRCPFRSAQVSIPWTDPDCITVAVLSHIWLFRFSHRFPSIFFICIMG